MNHQVEYRIYKLPFDIAQRFRSILKSEDVLYQEEFSVLRSVFNVRAARSIHDHFRGIIVELNIERSLLKFSKTAGTLAIKEIDMWPIFYDDPIIKWKSILIPVVGHRDTVRLFERYCRNNIDL
jgi:hypothetical protein